MDHGFATAQSALAAAALRTLQQLTTAMASKKYPTHALPFSSTKPWERDRAASSEAAHAARRQEDSRSSSATCCDRADS
jgi:hypothetical protein